MLPSCHYRIAGMRASAHDNFIALNAEEPDAHRRHVREPAVSLQEPGMSLSASVRDGSAFCMRDDAAAIERFVRLDRCN